MSTMNDGADLEQPGGTPESSQLHYVVIYLLARYLSGEVRAGSDASEVRWATHEELNALDMHPRVRETVHATWLS